VQLERERDRIVFGWMTQPVPTVQPLPEAQQLAFALGVGGSSLPLELYDNGTRNVFFVLESEERVARLEPDIGALLRLTREGDLAFVHASCLAGSGSRWRTRMFAPADGVAEDPATGSAAGPLACHLARHGLIVFGAEIEIVQGVELGRPSRLYASVEGSGERIEEVRVGGSAVIVARGEFRIPAG
jgi:trans-2,3-dihydro-3-hydroxyanthranilate isomerase